MRNRDKLITVTHLQLTLQKHINSCCCSFNKISIKRNKYAASEIRPNDKFCLFWANNLGPLMVWAWNLVCGHFINFRKGRKFLTSLTFGCPIHHWWPNLYNFLLSFQKKFICDQKKTLRPSRKSNLTSQLWYHILKPFSGSTIKYSSQKHLTKRWANAAAQFSPSLPQ